MAFWRFALAFWLTNGYYTKISLINQEKTAENLHDSPLYIWCPWLVFGKEIKFFRKIEICAEIIAFFVGNSANFRLYCVLSIQSTTYLGHRLRVSFAQDKIAWCVWCIADKRSQNKDQVGKQKKRFKYRSRNSLQNSIYAKRILALRMPTVKLQKLEIKR